jgi:hypothetical protein
MTTTGNRPMTEPMGPSISRPSQSPVRLPRTGLLLVARWLPVALSFWVTALAIGWLILGVHPAAQATDHDALLSTAAVDTSRISGTSSLLDELPQDRVSAVFSSSVMFWAPDIERWSVEHGLNPNLAATVMQIESCGHPTIQSHSGAIGLFQVMPYHFATGEHPLEPETNAARGLAYLVKSYRAADGRLPLALAGYNGGIGVIAQQRSQWSQETRRYVRWGMGILKDIAAGLDQSPTLQSWLQHGGERLCQLAVRQLSLRP